MSTITIIYLFASDRCFWWGRVVRNTEELYIEMIANLEANGRAVPYQVKGTPEKRNPKNVILAEELVEVLVKEKNKRSHQAGIQVVHLTFAHVCHDESTRDLCRKQAECQHIKNWMIDE